MAIPSFDRLKTHIVDQIQPMIDLLEIKDRELDATIKAYEKRLHILFPNRIPMEKPHCLFDWAVDANLGIPECLALLRFAELQISQLLNTLDSRFHKQIKLTGKLILLEFDNDPNLNNNPRFMNYLGEFACINYILQTQGDIFQLLTIERKLPNGKKADFELLNKSNNDRVLIDTMSIHSIDVSKVQSDSDLVSFLEGRFSAKISDKTKGLAEDGNRIILEDGSRVNFTILPIIWNEIETLLPFKKAFEIMNTKKYVNVLPCVALHPQKLDNNTNHLSLTSVSNILDRWEDQKN